MSFGEVVAWSVGWLVDDEHKACACVICVQYRRGYVHLDVRKIRHLPIANDWKMADLSRIYHFCFGLQGFPEPVIYRIFVRLGFVIIEVAPSVQL
jgi:hypothetical protein